MASPNAREVTNPQRILDRHTVQGIVTAPPMGSSDRARQYCSFASFTNPTGIRLLVESMTGGIEITPEMKKEVAQLQAA
jgi:hypothetical protein